MHGLLAAIRQLLATVRHLLAAELLTQLLLAELLLAVGISAKRHVAAQLAGDIADRGAQALVAELRGMPQEEIARQLGIGRNALYKLGHDARQQLKARLSVAGVKDEDVRAAFDL